MSRFTTYEAIKYVDLARNPSDSKSRSIRGFLNTVLELNADVQIKTDLIQKNMQLRQGKKLYEIINDVKLNENQIIENINKHLRSTPSIEKLDKQLIEDIANAENINDSNKYMYVHYDDFAKRLFHILKFTAFIQPSDFEEYGRDYADALTISYQDELDELDFIDGKYAKELLIVNGFMKRLTKVSDAIYDDIKSKEKRYHSTNIDAKLLTLGKSIDFVTHGKTDSGTFTLSSFFDSRDNLFIYGEGGIGKTTFLIHKFCELINTKKSEYIPIFITLTKLKNDYRSSNSLIKSAILDELKKIYGSNITGEIFDLNKEEAILKVALDFAYANKKILLFLDGFNEISNSSNSSVRHLIKNEINELTTLRNIRIILTSRPFYDMDIAFPNCSAIEATGISDETLNNYLTENKFKIPKDKDLHRLLHNPLFLLMHVTNLSNGITTATTRGGILYEYCNGNSSIYTELLLLTDPAYTYDESLPTYIPLLLDFVMPAIAATMEINDSFYITPLELDKILQDVLSLTMPFDEMYDPYFKKYKSRMTISSVAREMKLAGNEVVEVLTDRLSFLQQDSYNNFFFVHQYIKDYFACLFRIFTYRQKNFNPANPNFYYKYASSLLDNTTVELTKEIAYQSKLCDLDLLKDVLKNNKSITNSLFINNMFMMLSAFNDNSLAGINFDTMDLSTLPLTRYRFSLADKHANFNNCYFSEQSFLSYYNSTKVLRTFTFFDAKPAICEIIMDVAENIIKFIDYKTGNDLILNVLDNNALICEGEHTLCNKILVSPDNDYIVLYDQNFSIDFFFVYSVKDNCLVKNYFPDETIHAVFAFDSNKLICVNNIGKASVYDLTFRYDTAAIDYTYDSDNVLENIPLINPLDTNGTVEEFEITFEDKFFKSSTGKDVPLLNSIYVFDDKYVLIFNTYSIETSFIIFDKNSSTSYTTGQISDTKVLYNNQFVASCAYGNTVYFSFDKLTFIIDVSDLSFESAGTLFTGSYLFLHRTVDKLYAVKDDKSIIVYDYIAKEIDEKFTLKNVSVENFICNDNYLVIGNTNSSLCKSNVLRLSTNDLFEYNYGDSLSVVNIIYLSGNRILIAYSTGYVVLVDATSFSLLDTYSLKDGSVLSSVAYNASINKIAAAYTVEENYSSVSKIAIVNVISGNKIKIDTVYSIEDVAPKTNILFTNNGEYLYAYTSDTIDVYETKTFDKLTTHHLNKNIYTLSAFDKYMYVFFKENNNDGKISFTLAYIENDSWDDISDLYSVPSMARLNDSLYKNVLINKIAPMLYEIIYPRRNAKSSLYGNLQSRFIHLTDSSFTDTNICDLYEDDILIHCSLRDIKDLPNRTYKLINVDTKFAHVDEKLNSFFSLNKNDSLLKTDLDSNISTTLNIIPNLSIRGCEFKFKHTPSAYIQNIITDNLGSII